MIRKGELVGETIIDMLDSSCSTEPPLGDELEMVVAEGLKVASSCELETASVVGGIGGRADAVKAAREPVSSGSEPMDADD